MSDALRTGDALVDGNTEGDAELVGDVLCLGHHFSRERPAERILADAGESRPRQGTDGIESHVAPKLQPDLRADITEHRRLQSGPDEAVRDQRHSCARRAVRLADRESIALDMFDDPWGDQFGCRIHHAADDATRRDVAAYHTARVDTLHLSACQSAGMPVEVPI